MARKSFAGARGAYLEFGRRRLRVVLQAGPEQRKNANGVLVLRGVSIARPGKVNMMGDSLCPRRARSYRVVQLVGEAAVVKGIRSAISVLSVRKHALPMYAMLQRHSPATKEKVKPHGLQRLLQQA